MKKVMIMVAAAAVLGGCSPKVSNVKSDASSGASGRAESVEASEPQAEPVQVRPIESTPLSMVLKASAFKMSGDYANNVAVTVGPDGNLTYFPAPSDITPASKPTEIGDGWWLNRQGIGPNSVFTRYTFEEYSALPATPSVAELKAAIIPGAIVTDFRKLSVDASKATSMPAAELLEELKK